MPRPFIAAVWASIIAGLLAVTILVGWAVWPYNDVEIEGEPRLLSSSTIPVGGRITFERDLFCNYGVDTTIYRRAELMNDKGAIVASFSAGDVRFFAAAFGASEDDPFCQSPSRSTVILPNYINPGTYRLELITTYKPNPVFTRSVVSYTPMFTVVE